MSLRHRTAAIIAIGDELILGQKIDTNSAWIASRLTEAGVRVVAHETVDDDVARIQDAIVRCSEACDLVVLSGGLGPTADDLTRDALAQATSDTLVADERAAEDIRSWFADRGMPEANLVQAMRPSRGACLPNRRGTAPGLHARHSGTDLFALPGPPVELKPMFDEHVVPALRPAEHRGTRVMHTVGLGESSIAERLADLMHRDRNPLVGTTASGGIVSVRIRCSESNAEQVRLMLDQTEHDVAAQLSPLGPLVIRPPVSDASLTESGLEALSRELIGLLSDRGEMLAVCESCTAGMLASTIADVPGSSAALAGGFTTYANDLKTALAGVDPDLIDEHGAVSAPVAAAMAEGTLTHTATHHALSVTGIAGPGGGSDDKPVGTVWIALATRDRATDTRRFAFKGSRQQIRQRAVVSALAMLRQRLLGFSGALLAEASQPMD